MNRLIPFTRIHVVSCEHDPFAQQFVVEHQHCAVEELDLIVPQQVEELWFRRRCITNEPEVIL